MSGLDTRCFGIQSTRRETFEDADSNENSRRLSRNISSENYFASFSDNEYMLGDAVPSYELSQRLHEVHSRRVEDRGSVIHSAAHQESVDIASQNTHHMPSNGASVNKSARREPRSSLKSLGLKFLNARQHFALAICRDLSLIPALIGIYQSWSRVLSGCLEPGLPDGAILTAARTSEHFLAGLWCVVSAYMSYSVLDGLMIRWIVTYSTSAAILRMLSMSTIMVTLEQYLVSTFTAEGYRYGLHIWILISCILTLTYIVQSFVTSNLDLKGKERARFFDLYNIVVFAVVPIGVASFVTMISLLRSLLILRLDIEERGLL